MKRSAELTPLSHDHHQALFAARQLKGATEEGVEAADFLSFWEDHGRAHFAIEEEILLPAWVEGDPEADRGMAARVLDEHLAIRAMARRLARGGLALEQTRELGAMLERHVRFEERELFPRIEAGLAEAEMVELGAEIAAGEARMGEAGG